MGIFRLDGFSRWSGLIGKAVARAHEIAHEFGFEHFNFSYPLARCRTNPARDKHTRRKAMMLGEGRSVHVGSDERNGVESFFDRDAADEGRDFAGDLVEAAKHDVLAGGFHSGALQHIAQARTRKACGANRAFAPLNAGDLRTMQTAPVAGAFERVDDRMSLDPGKLGETERERLVYFPAQREAPVVSVEFAWLVHVIPHEEVRDWSEPGVEIFDRGLDIEKAEGAKDHSVLAGKLDGLLLRESPNQDGGCCACGNCAQGDLLEESPSGVHSRTSKTKAHIIREILAARPKPSSLDLFAIVCRSRSCSRSS